MNVDGVREYCLSFTGAKENMQWGETLCFKVNGKIFALLSLELDSETRLTLKCSPECMAELLEFEGVRRAPYVGRYDWAALERLDCLPAEHIRELIRNSYEIISAKSERRSSSQRRTKKSK